MDEIDRLKLFVTFGGVPLYHEMLRGKTYDDCIKSMCLSSDWVQGEVAALVATEFSRTSRTMAILSAISHGAVGLKEISERVKADDSICLKDLEALEYVGIVGVVTPMLDAPRKSKMYVVKDNLFAFNFEVMDRIKDARHLKDKDLLLEQLRGRITTFMGKRFEMFCVDLIRENYLTNSIGKWWMDRDGVHEEVDIVAESTMDDNKYIILAECKFRTSPVGFSEYNDLVRRSRRFDKYNIRLMMISASGFDAKMAEFARDEGVMLVGPDEIFGRAPMPELK
ncbi:MAG: DUF234 domain-containing protein [Thermoplasmata archaeon]|nr:DUF234 domain-containing protein [Thermoplasmata archaeon]